jgi:predicted transcriptional regulator
MSTSRQTIFQCIVDHFAVNLAATRQVIAQETGLNLSAVDDHVKPLRGDGLLRNVVNGVVEPMDTL